MEGTPLSLPDLIRSVEERAGDEPLAQLQAATDVAGELGDVADQLLDHFVSNARQKGCSWAQIGERFGVSKQAVQQRFMGGRGGRHGAFRRLGDEARAMVEAAQEEARKLGHNHVGTEHLLIAALEQADASTSESLGVTADAARARVAEELGRGEEGDANAGSRVTPAARRALMLAIRGAHWMGHEKARPEHLLLGILRQGHSGGAQVLTALAGGERKAVRDKLLAVLFPEGAPEWVTEQRPPPWAGRRRRGGGGRGWC